jgi:phosphoglycolate phosphatase
MSRYKHIIWDWNGTLLNDAWLCVEIINSLLQKRGKPGIDLNRYQQVFDFPIENYYKKLGFDFSEEPFEQAAVEFIEVYYARVRECNLQTHAVKVLQSVQSYGISQSLLSASEHESLINVVHGFDIDQYFETVQGIEDHYAQGKTHLVKRMVDHLQLAPKKILFIGDTVHDYDVAMTIGADSLLIPGGHHTREKLLPINTPVLDSLYNILDGLNGDPG